MPDIHAARRVRLRALLAERDVEAALVSEQLNVRYLTGFTGSNGALLVLPEADVLTTDGRYETQSAEQSPDVERLIVPGVLTALVERARDAGIRRLGFEEHQVTVEVHEHLLRGAEGIGLAPLRRAVEQLRAVKDDAEVALLRRACAIADAALAELLAGPLVGRTERDVGIDLDARMRALGADGPSFETIVASGPNSAIPHHRPTARVLGKDEFLKLDFGALVEGYHSDMTRTVVLGTAQPWQRELYALVARAQQAAIDLLRAGATTGELDAAARDVIDAAGHGERFGHSLGHGVGLEIHEAPTLRSGGSDTLALGMPVTVEPGVYLPGQGGVRIEDLLVVTDDGADALTTTTRELLEL